jgi:TPR repeat protein
MCKGSVSFVILLFLGLICHAQQTVAQLPGRPLSAPELDQLQAQAQGGDPVAQVTLAKAYEDGNGIAPSDKDALKWYRAAAEQGNAAAQHNVGLMLWPGRGVEKDKQEAIKWFRKAAKQEYPSAMFNMGTVYYNGDEVLIDDVTAFAWFLLAQNFGSPYAVDAVRRMKEEKKHLESDALEKIGDMYQTGADLPQNSSEATKWYRKAAENGTAEVQIKLANLLLQGRGGVPNYAEVHSLCEKAASSHYPTGDYCIGKLYDQGWGVERDLSKAAKWFREAAKMGHSMATLRLGEMYWKGEGVKQDKISGYGFIYLASTSDLPEAKEEKERLEKELTPKELNKAKEKAVEWSRQYPPVHHPLVLKASH